MADSQLRLNLAVEGRTDLVVLTKLLNSLEISVLDPFIKGGKIELLNKLDGYNQSAKRVPWLVVIDLDQEECAPGYLREILPSPSTGMMLRIPVREIEAWLLADREKMARFLGISVANFQPIQTQRKTPNCF